MDRLFSKLNLNDIKVGEKSSFPPDADPYDEAPPVTVPEAATHAPAPPARPQIAQAADPGEPIAAPDGGRLPEDTVLGMDHDVPTAPAEEDRVVTVNNRGYRPGYGEGVPEDRGEILKVSSRSRPSAVAGAIAGVVRENGRAEVQAIGAGAANQAIKAVAIARDYLKETNIEAICLPSLIDLTIDDADRTAIRLVVEMR